MEVVSGASILRGVNRVNGAAAAVVLSLDDRFSAQPVVPMNDIERCALVRFGLCHEVNEVVAHIVHLSDEIRMELDWAAVVVYAVDHVVGRLAFGNASEDMHFVAAATKTSTISCV